MPKAVHYYFAYGSNMNPARVEQRQMGFHSALAGELHNYRLAFNKRSVKYPGAASANVMAAVGQVTEGVIYQLTHPKQIEMMDPYEGYPKRYDRLALPIRTSQGEMTAWVYIANVDYITEGLQPARWYLNHLLAGRDFLSSAYFDGLAGTACMPDSEIEPS